MEVSTDKNPSVIFIGTLVPDTPEFQNPALGSSGLLVQEGIVEGLLKQDIPVRILSSQPMPSFPNYKALICKRKKILYKPGAVLITLPALNILVIRELMRGFYALFSIMLWALKNAGKKRCILLYGVYSPPLPIVYLAGKLTRTRVVPILMDLGMPPKKLKLGKMRMSIYASVEFFARLLIPRVSGRIVINDYVAEDYAPGKHFLLVDGGISNSVISRLFDLNEEKRHPETIFLCAGALWPINGTQVVLDAMRINENPNVNVWFAGKGIDLPLITEAEAKDDRIKYLGMLTLDQLFSYYKQSDVLMNIRVTEPDECRYLFPSKFFEYLATGKYVLTTSVAHLERDYGGMCTVLPDTSAGMLAKTMDGIAGLPKEVLLEKGARARRYMLENRTWESQSARIADYLRNTVLIG